MKCGFLKESVHLRRFPELGNLEVLRARYFTQTFSRHVHEGYALGVIEDGALAFRYRGENVVAARGMISLVIPDEPHTGQAAGGEGWAYRMFYLETPLLERAATELAGRSVRAPVFRPGVLRDDALARSVGRLHADAEGGHAGRLEMESRLTALLIGFIRRHAEDRPAGARIGREHGAVRRAREYLREHFDRNVSLDELAGVARLSPFHLVRVFSRAVGIPPHTYLNQVRVAHARELLEGGSSLVDAALATGFADQSHFSRHFKRIAGITPGQYRKIVQDPIP